MTSDDRKARAIFKAGMAVSDYRTEGNYDALSELWDTAVEAVMVDIIAAQMGKESEAQHE